MQIIGVTGLPSSGKGTFSKVAAKYDFQEIVMGDVIRNEVRSRGLELTRENSNKIMVQLREERGENVVAELSAEWINKAIDEGSERILIDGIRSRSEVDYFKTIFPELQIVAIHADPDTRYIRSKARRRKDDAYSREAFDRRDDVELSVGIGDVIALADVLIPSPDTLEEANELYSSIIMEMVQESSPIGVVNGY